MITECLLCCQHCLRYLFCGSPPGALFPPRGRSANVQTQFGITVRTTGILWGESSDAAKHPSVYVRVTPAAKNHPPHVNYVPILWMKKLSLSNVK